jgi:hypothetical protein
VALSLFMESDNTITLTGLLAPTGYLQSATVTWKITNVGSTTAIGAASGSMTLDSGSTTGDYSAEIDATVVNTTDFTTGNIYWGWYTAVQGAFKKVWRCDVVTAYANESD